MAFTPGTGGGPVPAAAFKTTCWSDVLRTRDEAQRDAALNALCAAYWNPLYAYLRRDGKSPEDAEDLVQGFLAKLSHRGDFEDLDPSRGRLRTFLLTSLRNHMLNHKAAENAQRRGGGNKALPLHLVEAENLCAADLAEGISPELAYDRTWARTVLSRACDRVRDEHRRLGKEGMFEELAPFLHRVAAANDYEVPAKALAKSTAAIATAVKRLRDRVRAYALQEASLTVGTKAEAERELVDLYRRLTGAA